MLLCRNCSGLDFHTFSINTVAQAPDAVDHTPAAVSFGSTHTVVPPAGSAHAVVVVVYAVVGTTHRSFATTLRWRNPAVVRNRTLENPVGAVGPVASDPPQLGPGTACHNQETSKEYYCSHEVALLSMCGKGLSLMSYRYGS
jgi:hypothetical protein